MTQPIFKIAAAAWQGTGRACASLVPLILPTFLLVAALGLATQVITAGRSPLVLDGVAGVTLLLDLLIRTPLTMAVYRLHLLGERGAGQVFSNWPRLWRLFRGLFLIEVGALLATVIIVAGLIFCLIVMAVIAHIHVAGLVARLSTVGVIILVSALIWWRYILRRVLVLPAIAVDAPDATMGAARARTEGRVWQMAGMVIATGLPMGLIAVLWVVGRHMLPRVMIVPVPGPADLNLLTAILGGLWFVASSIVSASLFSLIYRGSEASAQTR